MSLDSGTIETLRRQFEMKQTDWIDACKEIDELRAALEKKDETIKTLELAVATMRRRLESLEGVAS